MLSSPEGGASVTQAPVPLGWPGDLGRAAVLRELGRPPPLSSAWGNSSFIRGPRGSLQSLCSLRLTAAGAGIVTLLTPDLKVTNHRRL